MEAIETILSLSVPHNKNHNELWGLLFDHDGIESDRHFNERMLLWINARLGSSYDWLPAAQQAYAESEGAWNWNSLDTVTEVP